MAVLGASERPSVGRTIVENLDRISRQTARKALRSLERIVEAGVVLVTLTDGKQYTETSLDEDPVSLLMSIGVFVMKKMINFDF